MTANSENKKIFWQGAGILVVAACLGTLPALAGQNQDVYQPPQTGQGQGGPGVYQQGPPPYQQGAPTYQGQPPYQQGPGPYQGQAPYEQGQPTYQQPEPAYQPLPPSLTLPAGTVITVRTSQWLSSDRSRVGDQFTAVADRPVIVDGWVVARRGQTVMGRVVIAEKSGHGGKKESQLGIELTDLTLVDGQQVPLKTQLTQASGGGIPAGQTVATVAVPTGIGAAIGAAAGGWRHAGEGAGIGAVAGAAAGIIGVLLTPGKPTVIPPETQLTFRQEAPITISTARSAQAFQPVTQQDYGSGGTLQYRPQHVAPAYPPTPAPAPYYWGNYPWYPGWGYYYPYPAFGVYYGFGPRFFGGPRFVIRGRR